jgi:hypothetical protein
METDLALNSKDQNGVAKRSIFTSPKTECWKKWNKANRLSHMKLVDDARPQSVHENGVGQMR